MKTPTKNDKPKNTEGDKQHVIPFVRRTFDHATKEYSVFFGDIYLTDNDVDTLQSLRFHGYDVHPAD